MDKRATYKKREIRGIRKLVPFSLTLSISKTILIINKAGGFSMSVLLKLYFAWFKIGMFTFGGGYAMLPLIQKEVIDKHHWASEEEILDYYAIGQCTPGIIAVNTATFVGYYQKGVIGAIASTLGVVSPSVIIITLIAALISNFMEITIVQHALAGINVAVCMLMINAIMNLWNKSVKNIASFTILDSLNC